MAVIYSQPLISARLEGVVTALGGTSSLLLKASGTTLVTLQLSSPAGTVDTGILTFSGQIIGTAAATGEADSAVILDSDGATAISGLTVGIPGGTQDVIISNGLNSTVITAGQVVELLSAQITGS